MTNKRSNTTVIDWVSKADEYAEYKPEVGFSEEAYGGYKRDLVYWAKRAR